MQESDFRKLHFSLLGKNSELEGDFKFSGDILINCIVKGNITMVDGGKITLEREARLEGNIYCQDIEVFGEIHGSVDAAGTMMIRSSAIVSGTIHAKNLSIFPGATINMEGHTAQDSTDQDDELLTH